MSKNIIFVLMYHHHKLLDLIKRVLLLQAATVCFSNRNGSSYCDTKYNLQLITIRMIIELIISQDVLCVNNIQLN
jgi:hypothetical protein